MSALVSHPMWIKLFAVRGFGPVVHFVRAASADPLLAESLCGQGGPLDKYARPKWTRVKGGAEKFCNACHAAACREPTRVDWS